MTYSARILAATTPQVRIRQEAPVSYSMPNLGPYTKPLDQEQLEADLIEAVERIPDGEGTPRAEILEHAGAAAKAIVALANKIGVDGDELQVTISGHADPGHVQRPNWAPEFISLNVGVKRTTV